MNAAAVAVLAMVLLAAIPSGATSEDSIPYINIEAPQDGSTVGTEETLVVMAEGNGLQHPAFSIEGENVGVAGPLTGCIYTTENGMNSTGKMYCKQKLNLKGFENQKVRVSANVQHSTGVLTDSVGLYVSGHCA